jgi:hypothetical protein
MNGNIEHVSLSLPDQKNYEIAYGLAFKLVSEKLANLENLEEQCRKSDSLCQTETRISQAGTPLPPNMSKVITLKFLNRVYRISLLDMTISLAESSETIELRDQILILHYLTGAKGTPLSGELIAYQELREGAPKPLIDYCGANPERLPEISSLIGGCQTNLGDIAVTIPAFSRVPVTVVIWRGDDEFPPNANILFDKTILDYLPAEDINVLCQSIVWRLVKAFQSGTQEKL